MVSQEFDNACAVTKCISFFYPSMFAETDSCALGVTMLVDANPPKVFILLIKCHSA
jgi:hypothetical protein